MISPEGISTWGALEIVITKSPTEGLRERAVSWYWAENEQDKSEQTVLPDNNNATKDGSEQVQSRDNQNKNPRNYRSPQRPRAAWSTCVTRPEQATPQTQGLKATEGRRCGASRED